jgi:hypothetical protein
MHTELGTSRKEIEDTNRRKKQLPPQSLTRIMQHLIRVEACDGHSDQQGGVILMARPFSFVFCAAAWTPPKLGRPGESRCTDQSHDATGVVHEEDEARPANTQKKSSSPTKSRD